MLTARSPPDDLQERNPDLVEQDGVSEGIEALPGRLARYSKAKVKALDVAEYMRNMENAQVLKKNRIRLENCGEYLVFHHFFTVDRVKLAGAQLCMQHLLCPLCAIRRGAKSLKAYLDRYENIKIDRPELKPYLITLTVKDGSDLLERFMHLRNSQRELWKRKQRKRGSVLDGIAGAVWSYEVKRGKNSGQWHPHLHMIALSESLPDQQDLSKEWHDITGDSFIVDVTPINIEDPASGFIEVFKYAVKFSDQSEVDTVHAFKTLSGKRLIGSSGCFRGVPEPEGLLDDKEALEGLPYITLFYRFLPSGYTLTP